MNFKIRALTISVFASLTIAPAFAAPPLTVSSTPVADSFVSSANPVNNYGAGGALALSADGLPKGSFASLIRFDTAAATTAFDATFGVGQWSVQSASLRLTATTPNNAIFNNADAGQFSVSWMESDAWVEGTGTPMVPTTTGVTFNTLPSFLSANDAPLGSFTFGGGISGSTIYTLNLPLGFTNDIWTGGLLSMRLFAEDSSVSYLFNSRNFGTVANRPELSITVVPEPTCIALLFPVVLLIAARHRR
ncbi:MAG: hypothetical protein HS101_07865 [Planctomycetia bacterium]|nr:hypothetical protein [Planctomycetia bacterium]